MQNQLLIIEDNRDIIEMYESILDKEFDLSCVDSIKDFKELVLSENFVTPDLSLIDIHLRDGSFLDLLSESKWCNLLAGWNKIFISGSDDFESFEKIFELGATDYLTKPFNFNELLFKCKKSIQNNKFSQVCQRTFQIAYHGNTSEPLTTLEVKLYGLLRDNSFVSSEQMIHEIWGENKKSQKIAVHISRLRKKLKPISLDIKYNSDRKKYSLNSVVVAKF